MITLNKQHRAYDNSWESKSLKRICNLKYGEALADEHRQDGSVPVYGSNGIVGEHSTSLSVGETIVIGRKGSAGKVQFSSKNCFPIDTTFYINNTVTRQHLKWLYYILQSLRLEEQKKDSAVPGLSREDVYTLEILLPNFNEQSSIASYLDEKCALIDTLIAKKQRQIELLQEQRAAIINQAVTKGLDESVEMKESGVEWIGEMPKHWDCYPIGYDYGLQGGFSFKSEDFVDEGIPIVKMSNLKNGCIDFSDSNNVPDTCCLKEFELHRNDLVIGMSGSIENYAVLRKQDLPCQLNQRVGRFSVRNKKRSYYPFLTYLIQSRLYKEQMGLLASGTAQVNISSNQIESIVFAVPPLHEQEEIVIFLTKKTVEIQGVILLIEHSIFLLNEYKTSLISHAVTGKVKVS